MTHWGKTWFGKLLHWQWERSHYLFRGLPMLKKTVCTGSVRFKRVYIVWSLLIVQTAQLSLISTQHSLFHETTLRYIALTHVQLPMLAVCHYLESRLVHFSNDTKEARQVVETFMISRWCFSLTVVLIRARLFYAKTNASQSTPVKHFLFLIYVSKHIHVHFY